MHQSATTGLHQAAPPEVPERAKTGMQECAQARVQAGAQAELYPRLRLRSLRTAILRRTSLKRSPRPPASRSSLPTLTTKLSIIYHFLLERIFIISSFQYLLLILFTPVEKMQMISSTTEKPAIPFSSTLFIFSSQ